MDKRMFTGCIEYEPFVVTGFDIGTDPYDCFIRGSGCDDIRNAADLLDGPARYNVAGEADFKYLMVRIIGIEAETAVSPGGISDRDISAFVHPQED